MSEKRQLDFFEIFWIAVIFVLIGFTIGRIEPFVPESNDLTFYTFSASIPQNEIDKVVKASNQAWFCERHDAVTNWCIAGSNGSMKTLTINAENQGSG